MGSTASSASLLRGALRLAGLAPLLLAPLAVLVVSSAVLAADIDYPEDEPEYPGRRSTWEVNTSLTFHRYLEPFPRVDTARACRNRCASERRCSGWTYYDAEFKEAGRYSYRLQRVCVLGSGIKGRQAGNRPGRISGVVRSGTHDGGGD